ncbi:hypothetical protein [Paraliomyxa miuraensis]|uniref:hypothetical protein n=1 Tax=Paraliomyxa miuraensis TaxID=376150 RepID=UPI00224CA455|nr:hypothetical protein [Paraliomyxa miuraensis]MCX4241863.1 hypothetical protein [Paraliomyxa miuraensis]
MNEPEPPTPDRATEPWRFVPTLEQHLPAGAVAEPVLELSQPRQRSVVVLAAVLRSGSEHVELERWTFEQNPDGESLRMVEGGTAIVRLRPGSRHPQLAELRRAVAAPRAVLTRPMGLPADEPKAALDQLAAALGILHDGGAEPRARVQAAATVVRALDDTVLLERDATWEVAAALDPVPSEIEIQRLSDRRAKAIIERPGGAATLELQRKTGGWAVSSADVPKQANDEPAMPETATLDASGDL